MAFCGARLRPGVQVVMEALGLHERIGGADLVITGEGSLDEQSLHGKVPAGVLEACELAGVPVAIVCGRATIDCRACRSFPSSSGSERVPRSAMRGGPDRCCARHGPSRRRAGRGATSVSGAIDRFIEAARALGLHPAGPPLPRGDEDRSRRRPGDRVRRGSDREVARLHGRRVARAGAHQRREPGGRGEARCGCAGGNRSAGDARGGAGGDRVRGGRHAAVRTSDRGSDVLRRGSARVTTRSGPPRARPTPCSPSRPPISFG